MNELNLYPESSTSLWIQHTIDGISGFTLKAKNALYCGSSPFQKVEVFDTYRFGRVLCLGGTIVMVENEDTYHEMMVHPALMMHPDPKRVCCIGGGDGGCLKELLKHDVVEEVVIVEIDALVRETVATYFPDLAAGFDDPRVSVEIDDGYSFLSSSEKAFDVILVDSYDPGGPVQSLETADFHEVVAKHLTSDGIAVFQTDSPIIRSGFLRSTIQSVSPFFIQCRPYVCSIRSFPEGICSFLLCTNREEVLEMFDEKRYTTIEHICMYYNADMHKGAFLLPQYLKREISL
jgi:spermidine synthase